MNQLLKSNVNLIRNLLIIKRWEWKTTYSDELDFEESDFETSLFPVQCYGNFKKSKKIVGKGGGDTGIRFSWHRPLRRTHHRICKKHHSFI